MPKVIITIIALLMILSLWLIFSPTRFIEQPVTKTSQSNSALVRKEFTLPDLDGKLQPFSQWNNKVVLINFWATWCPPCRREIPDFIKVYNEYKDKDFIIVGIGVDNEEKVANFVETMQVNYPILVGGKEAMQVSIDYGNQTRALPYSILIDKQGIIRYRAGGLLTHSKLINALLPLL
jgi:thiol-disulfide isomerase/thioredoxin